MTIGSRALEVPVDNWPILRALTEYQKVYTIDPDGSINVRYMVGLLPAKKQALLLYEGKPGGEIFPKVVPVAEVYNSLTEAYIAALSKIEPMMQTINFIVARAKSSRETLIEKEESKS